MKNSLIFSLLGHITLFSVFSFTFGNNITRPDYAPVSFWGEIGRIELNKPAIMISNKGGEDFVETPKTINLKVNTQPVGLLKDYYLKPQATVSWALEKENFAEKLITAQYLTRRKEPVVLFHPLLPYDFKLYFKDRQLAHVELMFNIVSEGRRSATVIRRKISSGNLEVDLLSMRYIGRYLFTQQSNFLPNSWRTVKIDLSANND